MADWIPLDDEKQFEEILNESKNEDSFFLIFKHSSRCSISKMANDRLKRGLTDSNLPKLYLLDILKNRALSDKIARESKIEHESPQVIIYKSGNPGYSASHMAINATEIKDQFKG